MSAAKQFYESARSRVSEIIAAAEKAPRPAKTTGHHHNGILFAVSSIVLAAVAEFFAFLRVSRHAEWTFVAALVIGAALPVLALGRACVSGGSRPAYAAVFSSGEAALAAMAAALSLFPAALFDGIGVQAAAMFAFAALFAGASSAMAFISVRPAVDASPLEAEELMRELDSAVACYDTDSELGEFSTLHRFREKLSSLEAHYRML